ncbi:hypothetical protein IFR05_004024 [Cadophora sp. M221]|nr:hypothetical protein IFR05_004024 [Cadophora sp. M221]
MSASLPSVPLGSASTYSRPPLLSPTRGLVSSRSPSPDATLSDLAKKASYNSKRSFDPTGLLQPRAKRQARVAKWTDIAKIYGHYIGPGINEDGLAEDHLRNTGKSGLTPLPTPEVGATAAESQNILARKLEHEKSQRARLRGFTAAELLDMEVLAYFDKDPMPDEPTIVIHPAFQLSNWVTQNSLPKHRGAVPLLGEYDGLWVAENPAVWAMIEPSLKLASLILTNPHTNAWFDALLYGVYTEIKNPDPK